MNPDNPKIVYWKRTKSKKKYLSQFYVKVLSNDKTYKKEQDIPIYMYKRIPSKKAIELCRNKDDPYILSKYDPNDGLKLRRKIENRRRRIERKENRFNKALVKLAKVDNKCYDSLYNKSRYLESSMYKTEDQGYCLKLYYEEPLKAFEILNSEEVTVNRVSLYLNKFLKSLLKYCKENNLYDYLNEYWAKTINKFRSILDPYYKDDGNYDKTLIPVNMLEPEDENIKKELRTFVKSFSKLNVREHQIRPLLYLTKNDRLLLYHGTGSGKTVVAGLFGEYCRLKLYSSRVVIFFVSPATLTNNFEQTMLTQFELTKLELYSNYCIQSYQKFATNSSDSCFENQPFTTSTNFKTMKELYKNSNNGEELKIILIIDEIQLRRNPEGVLSKYIVEQSWEADKVLLMTATPYINSIKDFEPILNILHGRRIIGDSISSGKYSFRTDGTTKTAPYSFKDDEDKFQLLSNLIQGRVDYYMRTKDNDDYPKEIYQINPINNDGKKWGTWDILETEKTYIDSYQKLIDNDGILGKMVTVIEDNMLRWNISLNRPKAFWNGYRRLANGLTDSDQFRVFSNISKTSRPSRSEKPIDVNGKLIAPYITDIKLQDFLNKYISEKLEEVCKILKTNQETYKRCIIYSNWIWQGVKLMCALLQKRLNSTKDISLYDILMNYNSDIQNLDTNNDNIREYTGETSNRDRTDAVEWYNELDNNLKILVISGVGGVGLDLKNTNALFILDPPWSPASEEQVIGRAVRYKSHESSKGRGEVNIYKMRLTFPDNIISGDNIVYSIIDKKRIELERIQELCKNRNICINENF